MKTYGAATSTKVRNDQLTRAAKALNEQMDKYWADEKKRYDTAWETHAVKAYQSNTASGASGSVHGYSTKTTNIDYGDYIYGTGTSTTPRFYGDSANDLFQKAIEQSVAAAMKEFTETLKDLQEQIDDIWEALNDDE